VIRFAPDFDVGDERGAMQRRILPWLETDDLVKVRAQLERWLDGFDLPPLAPNRAPHEWIMDGLPKGPARARAIEILAERVGALLDSEPELASGVERIYNLLFLAIDVARPSALAEPLFRMFSRRRLSGRWAGMDLRSLLALALAWNQIDARLEGVWRALLEGALDFLPATPYDGFQGVLLMPHAGQRGKRDTALIGWALAKMADHLQRVEARERWRGRFSELVDRVFATYPHLRGDLATELYKEADRGQWPAWAVECLPVAIASTASAPPAADSSQQRSALHRLAAILVRRLSGRPTENESPHMLSRAILPVGLLSYVPQSEYRLKATLCRGRVSEVLLTTRALQFVEYAHGKLEPELRHAPFAGEYSGEAVLMSVIAAESPTLEKVYGVAYANQRVDVVRQQLPKSPQGPLVAPGGPGI
jgi:hypothetical protein